MSVRDVLRDLSFIVSQPGDPAEMYDRAAARYGHYRELWLDLAGRQTESAMLEQLREIVRPGLRVLDAGAGTGELSRKLLALQPSLELTLLDLSEGMLAQAADIPGAKEIGNVQALPFADQSFDLVVSSWVIETVPNPMKAVQEFLRVIGPSGHVLYSFCSLPQGWLSRAGSVFLRKAVEKGFAGGFLAPERTPWHDCDRSSLMRFHKGLSSLVTLRKCCTVGSEILPCQDPDAATTTTSQ